jgi:hypothetical protein
MVRTKGALGKSTLARMSPEQQAQYHAKRQTSNQTRSITNKKNESQTKKSSNQINQNVLNDPHFQQLANSDKDSDDPSLSDVGSDEEEIQENISSIYNLANLQKSRKNRNLNDDDIFSYARNCVSEASQKQYRKVKAALENRGFEVSFRGLISFIICEDEDCLNVANSTIDTYISALKYILLVEKREQITPYQLSVLHAVQHARRRRYPDSRRITGAMNNERTTVFIAFLDELKAAGKLSDSRHQLFVDAARMLYGCALRFFQLVLLESNSFFPEEEGEVLKDLYMEVQAKAAEMRRGNGNLSAPPVDNKQVHPLYQQHVMEIVRRRGTNTILFHDFPQHRAEFSELIKQCAILEDWPVEHRFSGTHVFRHGAAQDAFQEGKLRLAMLRTGHLSQKAAREYARTDAERSSLAAKYKGLEEKARKQFLDQQIKEAQQEAKVAFNNKSAASLIIKPLQQSNATSQYNNSTSHQKVIAVRNKINHEVALRKKATSEIHQSMRTTLDPKPGNLDIISKEGVLKQPSNIINFPKQVTSRESRIHARLQDLQQQQEITRIQNLRTLLDNNLISVSKLPISDRQKLGIW